MSHELGAITDLRSLTKVALAEAIRKLHEAQKLNAAMQVRQRVGGATWHEHETIDDYIHEALSALGD